MPPLYSYYKMSGVTLSTTIGSFDTIHNLCEYQGKLWIACGRGLNGTGRCVIRSYDKRANTLTVEYEVPVDLYTDLPFWRVLREFNGKLYAGLGNQTDSPSVVNTGDIYEYDGVSTWTKVLDTNEKDCYCLEVYNGKLYAGVGQIGGGAGKLYSTSNGSSWTLERTFTSDYVRALKVWHNKLWIGLRGNARLWSYDGSTFTDHNKPSGISTQVKDLVIFRDRLYLGCVSAKIYSWNEKSFTLEVDATSWDDEIYQGCVYNNKLYFPTNGQAVGGRVWKYDGMIWTQDYVDTVTIGQLQIAYPYAGYMWIGGGKAANYDLTLRRMKARKVVRGTRNTRTIGV